MAQGITEQDVFKAADALVADGQRPTQTSVREFLGGGSFATIGPALKRWKAAQAEQHELAEVELPDDLEDALQQLGGRLWQVAIEIAESRLSSEREALATAREELEAEAAEQAEAVAALEAEAEQRDARIAELEEALAGEQQVTEKQNQLIAGLTSDLSAAQAATAAEVEKVTAVYEERVSHLTERVDELKLIINRLTDYADKKEDGHKSD